MVQSGFPVAPLQLMTIFVQYLVLVLFCCNLNYVALSMSEAENFEPHFHQIIT